MASRKYLWLVIILISAGCNEHDAPSNIKTLRFDGFEFEAPAAWTTVSRKGIDSYIGALALDKRDTVHFKLGLWTNTLSDDAYVLNRVVERRHLSDPEKLDSTYHIVVDKPLSEVDFDVYMRNNVTWDMVDGHRAKIMYPRISGFGKTGVYIDSVKITEHGVLRFHLYGENLSAENEKNVLKAVKTIKFIPD